MLEAFLTLPKNPPHVLVVGDIIIDHYIWGESERLSPEAPVQVVDVKDEGRRLGGAGNVADNLIALGASVDLCGVVGADGGQAWLFETLQALSIGTSGILVDPKRPTSQKSRVMISKQQVLRVDRERKEPIDKDTCAVLLEKARGLLEKADVLILSDYLKGVLDTHLCQELIKRAKAQDKIILCDPKGKDYSKYTNADLITPNKKEAQMATGVEIVDDMSLKQALSHFKDKLQIATPLITLSEQGMAFLDKDLHKIPTIAKEVYDVSGAGDTVIAALAFCLGLGYPIEQACHFANAAAAVVVAKVGSAQASYAEVLDFLQKHHHKGQKVLDRPTLCALLQAMHPPKIIFTNGCFDLLHRGHVEYLQKAKALGGLLVVGLNSDSSVRRLKGNTRPVCDQDARAFVLAGLECVDFVVIFEEDTPLELIKALKPHILVKGADYAGKEVVGSSLVQEVVLIDFVKGYSTTSTLEKIQNLH
ncbi:D-glycero-beta-D-manno-heptose-7-phosphate kinase [Helicobacter sp. NHP22-001]|uniref:D-glycero-beta-D-manno-heptose-7-phosphate kinase n=1 Tax=Helicobacter sp. NHP22-001 TaxID=3040202 RepID=UPI00244D8600|nr:D-glycero-beta-D-manno-heptose-7-phosphate kinase [Helicobacter sp. NHP22-001]GMB96537.1 Bifunctional protein hldE [Helicobacter sp. NHP22-001]